MRVLSVALVGLFAVPLVSFKSAGDVDAVVAAPAPAPVFRPMPTAPLLATVPWVGDEPGLVAVKMRVKVTACSPVDTADDAAYYAKNGYAGSAYNIAANHFAKGTLIRVPGYLEKSYPGQFWEVDSRGGSVIRRSAARGVVQIDVKFRTLYSVKAWGVQWLTVDVITPPMMAAYEREHAAWARRHDAAAGVDAANDVKTTAYHAAVAAWAAERERSSRGDLGDVSKL